MKKFLDDKEGTIYLETITDEHKNSYPIMIARPITIRPDNLKEILVDKGYIAPQDAGI
jgi:hypothetical protein